MLTNRRRSLTPTALLISYWLVRSAFRTSTWWPLTCSPLSAMTVPSTVTLVASRRASMTSRVEPTMDTSMHRA